MNDKIVFIGDSETYAISYGGVTTADTFAYRIGISAGYTAANILNKGVNSNTLNDVLNRMNTDVVAYAPAVAVLMIGTNDVLQISASTFKGYLEQFVARMKLYNIRVVFITPPFDRTLTVAQTLAMQEFLRAMDDVAAANDFECVPAWHAFTGYYLYKSATEWNALYASDYTHLTPLGQGLIHELATRPRYLSAFKPPASKTELEKVGDLAKATADYLLDSQNPLKLPAITTARAALP